MKWILFLFIGITFLSCRRENNINITVNGQVINRITGQPVANLQVELYSCEDINFAIGSCVNKQTVYTDNNGNFSFQYTKTPGRYYNCIINESGYYPSDSDYGINNKALLTSSTQQNIVLNVAPKGGIKWKIYNTSCFNSSDHFILYKQNEISNYHWGSPFEMNGCQNYEGQVYGDYPMGYYYFHWQVTKNSITQDFYDTLYLSAFQDTIYTINY